MIGAGPGPATLATLTALGGERWPAYRVHERLAALWRPAPPGPQPQQWRLGPAREFQLRLNG